MQQLDNVLWAISIHALREEGDQLGQYYLVPFKQFLSTPSARRATKCRGEMQPGGLISIHALREEGDPTNLAAFTDREIFLSTPSARRATSCSARVIGWSIYFYPRPPRGGRRPLAGR